MIVGKRIPVIGDFDSDSIKIKELAKEWTSFSQYTDVEALLCILKNRELKANSIKNVDDLKEQRYLYSLIKGEEALPYVSCFDYTTDEKISLWNMYSNDQYGVRIRFIIPEKAGNFDMLLVDKKRPVKGCKIGKEPIEFNSDMHIDDKMPYPNVWVHIATKPIVYKNELETESYQLPASNLLDWSTLASVKSEDWAFQNEVRIVADFQLTDPNKSESVIIPDMDYLLIPINFSNIEEIVITFSPWMQEQTKNMLSESLRQVGAECKLTTENSRFDKLIRRK